MNEVMYNFNDKIAKMFDIPLLISEHNPKVFGTTIPKLK